MTVRVTAWPSINGAPAFAEETSGWLLLWRDAAFTVPLLPSRDDYSATHDSERGYLKGKKAGALEYAGPR